MNHERMLKIADMIEENPEHFDISSWATIPGSIAAMPNGQILANGTDALLDANLFECGTTACIAGWAVWLWGAEADPNNHIYVCAARILGLEIEDADDLFQNWSLTNAAFAAAHIRELVAKDMENSDA